jgi:divalent anion:Na+ symporter, DASS family
MSVDTDKAGPAASTPSLWRWLPVLALAAIIWLWKPGQDTPGVDPEGWKLLAVFLPCILGLMLQPMPGGAIVLLAIIASVLVGALPLEKALGGYMDGSVWMVLAAYFLARAFLKTGLARRVALLFIRKFGHNSLGLGYAVTASDTVLGGMIPSVAARVGGVTLPITRSLAELYKSLPLDGPERLGRYLMLVLYQGGVVACALFFTGQASNPLAAQQARELTAGLPDGPVILTYGNWLLYACVPALLSLAIIPAFAYWLERPAITRTPEAAAFARDELGKMGRPRGDEWILAATFIGVVALWIWGGANNITIVLTWDDLINERGAWDVFIWYGGLVQLGKQLKETGLLTLFAENVTGNFSGLHWLPLFIATLLVYFYAHYAFASITTHIVSMYPAFVVVAITAGAPAPLVVCAFAFFANFSAGLTHYGTTPGPIVYGVGYVPLAKWWRVGFLVSLVNVAIWLTFGLAWWKAMGLW